MTDLLTPIAIERPAAIKFGPGLAAEVGAFARANGCTRPLVVSDAFNASRVGLLDLPDKPGVFGTVRPEPDMFSLLERSLPLGALAIFLGQLLVDQSVGVALVQLPLALLLSAVAVQLVRLALAATDDMGTLVTQGSGADLSQSLSNLAGSLTGVGANDPSVPAFVVLLGALLVAMGARAMMVHATCNGQPATVRQATGYSDAEVDVLIEFEPNNTEVVRLNNDEEVIRMPKKKATAAAAAKTLYRC